MIKKIALAAGIALTTAHAQAGNVEGYGAPDSTGYVDGRYHGDKYSCRAFGQSQPQYTCVEDGKVVVQCSNGQCTYTY